VKQFILNYCMKVVNYNNDYDEEKLEIIKYGLEGLYLQITKILIIILLSILLGIFKEVVIFLLIYNIIRTTSFGLHATKSWICLLSSTLIFIGIPVICLYIKIPIYIKTIINVVVIGFIFKNSPADTKKRPIVNPKRRLFYKYISTFIVIIFAYISILTKNDFLSNCFMFAPLVQSFMIAPTVYKIFGLPYNNYLKYVNSGI